MEINFTEIRRHYHHKLTHREKWTMYKYLVFCGRNCSKAEGRGRGKAICQTLSTIYLFTCHARSNLSRGRLFRGSIFRIKSRNFNNQSYRNYRNVIGKSGSAIAITDTIGRSPIALISDNDIQQNLRFRYSPIAIIGDYRNPIFSDCDFLRLPSLLVQRDVTPL